MPQGLPCGRLRPPARARSPRHRAPQVGASDHPLGMPLLGGAVSTFAGRGRSTALTDFLAGLAAREHEPLLAKTTGRVCFELSDADGEEPQLVCIDNGHID